ncbi:unnamed protein product, partial [Brenthis ino]
MSEHEYVPQITKLNDSPRACKLYESCSGGAHAPCQLQQRPSDIANKTMRICPAPAHYHSPHHTAPCIQIPIANTVHPRDVTQKFRIGFPTLNNSHGVYFTYLLQSLVTLHDERSGVNYVAVGRYCSTEICLRLDRANLIRITSD